VNKTLGFLFGGKMKIYRPKLCECAAHCGMEVKPGRRFVYQHHCIGKHPSKKTIRKRSKSQKIAQNKKETKEKRSKSMLLLWQDPEYSNKTLKSQKEAQSLPEYIEKISKIQIKLWQDPKHIEKMCKANSIAQNRPEVKERNSQSNKITQNLPEVKKKRSESAKKMWQDPEHAKKMWEAFAILPNKPETFLINFLDNFYPNEWKYTGNFSFIVGGKSPDFVNEERKLIIEHYGTYWHRNDNPQDRIDIFTPFGYRTLIIWEHELKDFKTLRRKIFNFVENGI
jgi:hypothetical protein